MFLGNVPIQRVWDTAICKRVHGTALILVHSITAKSVSLQPGKTESQATLGFSEDSLVQKTFFKTLRLVLTS